MSEAKNCRLAAIQMISGPDVADNLRTAAHWIAEAAAQGAQLVVWPEYFPIIGATDAVRLAAREAFGQGPIQDWLAATAQRHGIWLVAGSLPLSADVADKLRNSCLLFDPAGACVARYDKIHLFAFRQGNEAYDEAAVIEALRPFWESRDKVLSLVFGWVRDQANASSKIFLPKLSKERH